MSARFILSRSGALAQYDRLKELGLRISYSVKTNPIIASILENERGSEFTQHGSESLETVKDRGRIWFYAQAWTVNDVAGLLDQGIRKFIVDNENDLRVLRETADGGAIDLLLRMKYKEHTIFTGRHFVFGMDAQVVNQAIKELKQDGWKGTLGVHVHRKSQNISEWSLQRELEGSLHPETLETIELVSIGGGIPSRYANSSDQGIDAIFRRIEAFVLFARAHGIEVMAEPGRFIAAPAVKLESKVIQVHGNTVLVDCSVYNASLDTLIVPLKLLVEGEVEDGSEAGGTEEFTIKGSTPDSMDIFRYKVRIPRPKPGDVIRFLNAGAYNFSTDFCDLPKIETEIIE